MLAKLILLFVGIPFIEMMLLIKLGEVFGFWNTILLVVGTGVLGAYLAKAQGFWIWLQIQQELQTGRMPAEKLIDGFLILIGGIVLLTPGLLTDIFGFALLVPFSRNMFKKWIRSKLEMMVNTGETKMTFFIG
ncbi:MAG: membrane protein FxsA [Candidatus Marinimicrobia bacterium]|nr:membrane protein FxsA [Candidatus Neomarinimicrobiota bacterium]